ncbi:alpha/beta hydrolase [Singulisphaera sp. Ch08]|uniref:Alpha/beta hydrolase n=1 Tax=Singulisphaera sp. Ch08 TaxID=3120278 RepID=A0AAU7CJJ8_9BACT
MQSRRASLALSWLTAIAVALTTLGVATAQVGAPKGKAVGKAGAKSKTKRREPAKKLAPNAADPIEKGDPDALDKAAAGMVHYRLKIKANDETSLNLVYYPAFPARLGTNAPVIMMVHEKERSSRDFEEPIAELKKQGFAEHMQSLGYAVLAVDLRGHGANVRKALTPQDWRLMVGDLQAAYQFLVDRHNRGKLNLAKLGVMGVGEGANLVAAWANTPGGGVSGEGRTSDLGAMVLVSPLADGSGFVLRQVMSALAPRIPLLLMAGERDAISADPVRAVRPLVERPVGGMKQNRVEFFDSSLHGYKLLWLEPKVTSVIPKFFETTIKLKATTPWEPRYNLTPVQYEDIQLVRSAKAKDAPAEKEKEQEKAKNGDPAEKEKAKEAPAPAKKEAS